MWTLYFKDSKIICWKVVCRYHTNFLKTGQVEQYTEKDYHILHVLSLQMDTSLLHVLSLQMDTSLLHVLSHQMEYILQHVLSFRIDNYRLLHVLSVHWALGLIPAQQVLQLGSPWACGQPLSMTLGLSKMYISHCLVYVWREYQGFI